MSWIERAQLVPGMATAQSGFGAEDLARVKALLAGHVALSKAGPATLANLAQEYYDIAASSDFDDPALRDEHVGEIESLLAEARRVWAEEAGANDELNEGLVAGAPSLPWNAGPRAFAPRRRRAKLALSRGPSTRRRSGALDALHPRSVASPA